MKKINFQETLSKTGNFIVENKKPLIYLVGAVVVVGIGYSLVKGVSGGIGSFFNPGKNTIGGKFNEQEVDQQKTTITQLAAKNYAESLFEAFNYSYGTDLSIIKNIFSKINSEDFKMIYNAFGKRTYSKLNGGSPSDKFYAPDTYIGNTNLDLMGWLNAELGFLDVITKKKVKPVVEGAGFVLS